MVTNWAGVWSDHRGGVAQAPGELVAWTGKEVPNARETEATRDLIDALEQDLERPFPAGAAKKVKLRDSVSLSLSRVAAAFGKTLRFVEFN